jgi:hypothetical protein
VHLVSFGINHRIRPKEFKSVSVIGGLANVPLFVDQFKAVKALGVLRTDWRITGQDKDRQNKT